MVFGVGHGGMSRSVRRLWLASFCAALLHLPLRRTSPPHRCPPGPVSTLAATSATARAPMATATPWPAMRCSSIRASPASSAATSLATPHVLANNRARARDVRDVQRCAEAEPADPSTSHLDYLATVRPRIGYVWGSFLPYVAGGLAWGRTHIEIDAPTGEVRARSAPRTSAGRSAAASSTRSLTIGPRASPTITSTSVRATTCLSRSRPP